MIYLIIVEKSKYISNKVVIEYVIEHNIKR